MADDRDFQPIIIKRKKHGGHGHHGGAWKVAFADFMTAMMAFFLVLWLVGQKPEVKEAVQGFFRDPGKFNQPGQTGALEGSQSVIKSDSPDLAIVRPPTAKDNPPTDEEVDRMHATAKLVLEELEKHAIFRELKKNVTIQVTNEGLRIILNESEDSPAFFEPGSAKLLQQSAIILVTIANQLGKIQNRIVLEGHTSSGRSGNAEYTNWELSADRANAARALMEVSGLKEDQVCQVRGFASTMPMLPQKPNDSRNRRVTILVLYEGAEKKYSELQVEADLTRQDSTALN